MTSRYNEIKEKTNESNKSVTRSTLYPPIPRALMDIYVMTTPGDRIDLLAQKYYSNIGYYWIIAEGNGIGKGTLIVPPGMQLRIPMDISTILQNYRDLNK